MANVFAPFGFAESHRLGAAPDYQLSKRYVNPANANPIYFGDPVVMVASSGYIAQGTPSGAAQQIAGIFAGCEYVSKSARKMIWSPWWPGIPSDVVLSGTGFDVAAKVIDDPLTAFRVQANGLCTLAMIGNNAQWAFGLGASPGTPAPNQISGIGNACLDVVTTAPAGTAFPFRIIDLIRDPPGVNGTDITTPYNWVFVTFNNQDYKVTTGHG
jgi:hypothetical protein